MTRLKPLLCAVGSVLIMLILAVIISLGALLHPAIPLITVLLILIGVAYVIFKDALGD